MIKNMLSVTIVLIIIFIFFNYYLNLLPSYKYYCLDYDDKKYEVYYEDNFSLFGNCNKDLLCDLENKKIQMKKCWKEEVIKND